MVAEWWLSIAVIGHVCGEGVAQLWLCDDIISEADFRYHTDFTLMFYGLLCGPSLVLLSVYIQSLRLA